MQEVKVNWATTPTSQKKDTSSEYKCSSMGIFDDINTWEKPVSRESVKMCDWYCSNLTCLECGFTEMAVLYLLPLLTDCD